MGIMERKMQPTITGSIGIVGYLLGLYWGYYIPMMENQMEKKMENEMETGGIGVIY